MMNGVAMFQEQVTFAKSNPLPPRSSFSVTARRFVIRADHICAYMQSWVGFKNHKYFIQTTLWSAIYSLLYMVGQIPIIYEGIKLIIQKKKVTVQIIMSLVIFLTVLFAAYIALISLRHFTVAMINLTIMKQLQKDTTKNLKFTTEDQPVRTVKRSAEVGGYSLHGFSLVSAVIIQKCRNGMMNTILALLTTILVKTLFNVCIFV